MTVGTVLIVGATGRTGRCLVRAPQDTSLRIRCLTGVRAKRAILQDMGVEDIVGGDLRAEGVAERAIDGAGAVLSAVGGAEVFRDGVTRLIAAAGALGTAPFMLETARGVGPVRRDPIGTVRLCVRCVSRRPALTQGRRTRTPAARRPAPRSGMTPRPPPPGRAGSPPL